MSSSVRVRFAPSPTGYLHIGGARTALFNWLYARRHGGTFILRIEDTDVERSSADMTAGILESLRWLGLDWDEGPLVGGPHGPYLQSERLALYREAAARLVSADAAYYCYCRPEDLNAKRQAAESAGTAWKYDRTCRALSADEIAARERAGVPRAVRFLVPAGETSFDDSVRGRITIAHEHIEDFVILRSDGHPTYQLSVVVDDAAMGVTEVVRGDDHISNTPKQVLLYRALGAPVPGFAHVPLILGPDRKRLSKRHGATSVGEYEAQGYLPEAMVNFLALLGWSPGSGDQEVFGRDELVARFALTGISGGNAIFNPEKLDWFNQQHIVRMPAAEILRRLRPRLDAAGLWRAAFESDLRPWIEAVVDLVKPRARKLDDIVSQIRPFVADTVERDEAAVTKYLVAPEIPELLDALRQRLQDVEPFDAATIELALRRLADERGVKAGPLIHATRVAVTGQAVSPGLFEVLELIGRDRVLARLENAGA
ncbi:MAG: glutamate--tRNA ligase [Acidobacteria bacterium]|nr:glutamate--tRNA ligase [Acidobacteriota bacterium]